VYSPERPIKILYSGRFDYQKGVDRLERIATHLTEAGVPFDLRLVGKPVMSKPDLPLIIPGARFLPATSEDQKLAEYYTEADIFLLPSRWEGLPLTVLEAMSFGNIVISTDVGAISEVVENDRTGFLIDAAQSEDDLVEAIHKAIADIFADPRRYKQLRLEASTKAMEASWAQSAASLARLLDNID
jgi:glycosyltransferase involved in cell wall biosynthesis